MSTKRTAADAQIDDEQQQQTKKNCINELPGDTAEINNSSDMVSLTSDGRKRLSFR